MRQLQFLEPGRVEWADVEEPRLTGPGEAIVRPLAVAACDLDMGVVRGLVPLSGPFALGHEGVVEVVDVGDDVTNVEPGDRAVLAFQISCGTCDRCRRGATGSCRTAGPGAAYGLGPLGPLGRSERYGGLMADRVRVPYADAMLLPLPADLDPASVASLSDNIPDAWRAVGPYPGSGPMLVLGAASIGLYCAGIAVALGRSVDYVDTDTDRLARAERLGATVIEGPPPRKLGPYELTVTTGVSIDDLHCALRSTEPEGTCVDTGIHFGSSAPMPLLEMYTRGIRYVTGRVNAVAAMPAALALIADGRLHPELVTAHTATFDDAPDAWVDMTGKLLLTPE